MKHTKTKKQNKTNQQRSVGQFLEVKLCVVGVPAERSEGKGDKKISEEKIAKNFPNLTKTKIHKSKKFNKPQTQESQRKLQYITIKVKTSDKEEILKTARKKGNILYMKKIADFSSETM